MGERLGFLLLLCAAVVTAQTQGTISGYVRDASGAIVPGASITVTHEGTGASRNTLSDAAGFYQVLGLVSGTY